MRFMKAMLLAGAAALCSFALTASQVKAAGSTYFVPAKNASFVPARNTSARQKSENEKKLADYQAELDVFKKARSAPSQEDKARRAFIENQIQELSTAQEPSRLTALGTQESPNQTGAGTVSTPAIPNSKSNYKRDKLEWSTPIQAYQVYPNGAIDLNTKYCWPADHTLIGRDSEFTTASTSPANDQQDAGKSGADNYLPTTPAENTDVFEATDQADCPSSGTKVPLTTTTPIAISQKDAEAAARWGWDFGTLVVPFKYQLSDQTAITSSATLGGYLGYRVPWRVAGLDFRPLVFAGVSEVPTSEADSSGKITSQTVAGISYGAGLLTTVKDSFNVGIVLGFDHVNSVQNYKYQDKPWISLEIGYSFTE